MTSPAAPQPGADLRVGELLLARLGDVHPAILFEDRTWTWDEHVHESADRAAWLDALRRDGPFHVGVLLDNIPEFTFLLGAAALNGAVVVGLNRTRRGTELARDIAATACQLVVTETRHVERLDGIDVERLFVIESDEYRRSVAAFAGSPVGERSTPAATDLFMLIFTSGTSGEPKAVRVTHRKVAGPGRVIVAMGGVVRDDVCYLSMPMFHSSCIMQGWAPTVAAGAAMVLPRKFSASGFLPDVRRYGVTYFQYVGKPLSYILATPEMPDDADNTLRTAAGNEAAPIDIDTFVRRFGCPVTDGFGSTEGGIVISRSPDTPPGSIGPLPANVAILDSDTGRPTARARFDAEGRLLNPAEAIGELVNVDGAGQFDGYYNNEAADAERMRDGMYWSGDLAYRDDAGFVYFSGRTIDWLRVDGENFGASPVERILKRCPSFSQVAVYAVPDVDTGDQVMAAVTLLPGRGFEPAAFADFLDAQADLSDKWVPRYVRVADQLPTTATNKVLKRHLAREAWQCPDPVWVRRDRPRRWERLDDDGRAGLRARFEQRGRDNLLPPATT